MIPTIHQSTGTEDPHSEINGRTLPAPINEMAVAVVPALPPQLGARRVEDVDGMLGSSGPVAGASSWESFGTVDEKHAGKLIQDLVSSQKLWG